MGLLWSCLPSIEQNTMCCVDVRTRKSVCHTENPPVYRPHVAPPNGVKHDVDDPNKHIDANKVEWGALTDVIARTDAWGTYTPDNTG